jgi:hypothetical protein
MLFGCVSQPVDKTKEQLVQKEDLSGVYVGSDDQTISASDIPSDTTTDSELDQLESELNQ